MPARARPRTPPSTANASSHRENAVRDGQTHRVMLRVAAEVRGGAHLRHRLDPDDAFERDVGQVPLGIRRVGGLPTHHSTVSAEAP